jgi:hypothetical protein
MGTEPSASEGTAHGSGEPARSSGGEGVVSILAMDERWGREGAGDKQIRAVVEKECKRGVCRR